MVLVVAQETYLGATPATASILSSSGQVYADLVWLNPFTAAFSRAVEVSGSGILLKFLVPKSLEFIVEKAINML